MERHGSRKRLAAKSKRTGAGNTKFDTWKHFTQDKIPTQEGANNSQMLDGLQEMLEGRISLPHYFSRMQVDHQKRKRRAWGRRGKVESKIDYENQRISCFFGIPILPLFHFSF